MNSINDAVLIVGAGINGAAIARELLLGGVGVCVVDRADLASGATAYSSRLIHGGLRYLEYREFDLVRESLAERTRLLRLAPHYVRPLRLFIPLRSRFGGLRSVLSRFLGRRDAGRAASRGLWMVRLGLWLYDAYARDAVLPRHRVRSVGDPSAVLVDSSKYRWLAEYSDAQIMHPERFVAAMLEDARRLAEDAGLPFRLFTYHRAVLDGPTAHVHRDPELAREPVLSFRPAAIINATGASVDETLRRLEIPSPRLMGPTKGSHLITYHAGLRDALGGRGIYTEADDGRPVFVLPFGEATLIGTTDEPFEGDPAEAVAAPAELEYLLRAVNDVVPGLTLGDDDIELHYSGVRPLPRSDAASTASVTRRHWLEENTASAVPFFSVIGGKLTTCRSLAEEAASTVLARLGKTPRQTSRDRPIPGGEDYPADEVALVARWEELARKPELNIEQIAAMWSLVGTRVEEFLREAAPVSPKNLAGAPLPCDFVRWIIRREWVTRLGDLVERRLMLLYHPTLTLGCLRQLAELMVEENVLAAQDAYAEVAGVQQRLKEHFGRQLADEVKPTP